MEQHLEFIKTLGSHLSELAGMVDTYTEFAQIAAEKEQQDTPTANDSETDGEHFTISTRFLRRCYAYVMQQREETLAYISGVNTGETTVLHELVPFELEEQEITYVKGDIVSSTAALIDLSDTGHCLRATVHNHPGGGKLATTPSHIDYQHHKRLEDGRYRALGIIMTRDGYVRFYTDKMPFSVTIVGIDGEWVAENLYQLHMDSFDNERTVGSLIRRGLSKLTGTEEEASND